jgi:imidazolonepropionase-like amidohydrolase
MTLPGRRTEMRQSKLSQGLRSATVAICLSWVTAIPLQAQRVTAIQGGTVLTMAGETIEGGTVLIRDGKIAEVGANVRVPGGAQIIDATGKYVMPGIIDAMTYYGIRPFELNDQSNPITPQNRAIQAYYPYGDFMRGTAGVQKDKDLISGGVTTVYIAPGDRQVMGGQGAVVKTWGTDFDSMILREPAAMDMTIGETAKREGQNPTTRMGIAALVRKTMLDAQEFSRSMDAYEQKEEAGDEEASPPSRNLGNEALRRLLQKEFPARIEVDFLDDIRTALRLSDEFDLDLILDSGLGAYKIREELAERGVPVVLGPPTHPFVTGGEVSMTADLYNLMSEYNASLLTEAGVKIAIASFGFGFGSFGGATQGRWLLIEAAYATGYGLADEDALKAITINAAEILGVEGRVGSLEAGKDADILILDGYPLDIKTWVEKVFVNGELIHERTKQD